MEDEEKFKVSKKLMKILSADTRTDILRKLEKRRMTASELSRRLDKHVTTISEHLDILKDSKLVERIERPGRKWVYYKLTKAGKRVLHPESYRWAFVFVATFLTFVGSWFVLTVDAYPGHFLYGLDRGVEDLQLLLTIDSLERAKKHIHYAEERLKEMKTVVKRGEERYVKDAARGYEMEMNEARKEIGRAREKGKDITSALETMSESAAKQTSMLENAMAKAPKTTKEIQSALNISRESRLMAIQELSNVTGKAYGSQSVHGE